MLGRGATSVVYLAEKTGSGKRYAVKVSICDREKLRREAFLLQKFSYPGIPCAVELLESGTKSFLVMEAVNGKSIGQRMRKGERFSSREILKTGIALSGILCYLHAQNPPVFYRDLKPDNVMITERGEIYLVDFGAAGTEETGVEVRYGTRGYAAPEQYDGKCDARSDLYALGALLAAMAKHAKKRQKRGLWRGMEKCMQKKPEAGKKAKRQEDSADLCSFCFSDRRSGCGCQQDAMGAVSGGRRMGGAGRSLVLRKSGGRRQSAELPESAGSVLKGRPSQSGGACGAGTCGILSGG